MDKQSKLGTQTLTEVQPKPLDIQTQASANLTAHSASATEIQNWLVAYLAEALEISPDEINTSQHLQDYGLDSSAAVGLTGDLGDWLGRELDPTLLLDHTTIAAIAKYLGETEEIVL